MEENKAVKKNAFQFMMDSRKKSIGQNSPGKVVDESSKATVASKEAKEKLLNRRSAFKKWADAKGGAKRKIEEEEKDAIIQVKLEKRAKRMKKLLTRKESSCDDDSNDGFVVKHKRRVLRLNSDSNDVEPLPSTPEEESKLSTPAEQKSLMSFFEVLNKKEPVQSSNDGPNVVNKLNNIDERVLTPKSLKKWKMRVKLLLTDLDDDIDNTNKQNKECSINGKDKPSENAVKLAPLFIKKQKVVWKISEATKRFLHSGIPESMKRKVEKERSCQDIKYDVFPSVSHVQQKENDGESEIDFWNLPPVELCLKLNSSPIKTVLNSELGTITARDINEKPKLQDFEKVKYFKGILQSIKAENPTFPVYETFKLFYECTRPKSAVNQIGRKKKRVSHVNLSDHTTWPVKYKPHKSDEIFVNKKAVSEFKQWLESWLNFKDRKVDYSSGSEFDTNDSSSSAVRNTIILHGPCGSGKTSAVYAVCKEMGIKILEVNASSKRTGKYLLQKLLESTQSHQVNKIEIVGKDDEICLLLIEDIDIIFDQDEGFISSLLQISTTTKRPIVLTTTDMSSQFAQRFVTQYSCIKFDNLSSKTAATWLQVVCLNEELYVSKQSLCDLLNYNKGDVRATLLQLQFWCQSGGQKRQFCDVQKLSIKKCDKLETAKSQDESLCWLPEKENDDVPHLQSNCIYDFLSVSGVLPYPLNLNLLWMNLPNVFSVSYNKKHKNQDETKPVKLDAEGRQKFKELCDFYDYVTLADVSHRKLNSCVSGDLSAKSYKIYDSLELNNSTESYSTNAELINEWSHTLIEYHINHYNKDFILNFSLPHDSERRWKQKQASCFEALSEAVSCNNRVNRVAIATDYMPSLRTISRSEVKRNANNNKRGRRFLNYLSGLGVNTTDKILITACNSLSNQS